MNARRQARLSQIETERLRLLDRYSSAAHLACEHFLIRTRSPKRDEVAVKALIASNSETATAIPTRPFLRSGMLPTSYRLWLQNTASFASG
jgi:hypothetical protein